MAPPQGVPQILAIEPEPVSAGSPQPVLVTFSWEGEGEDGFEWRIDGSEWHNINQSGIATTSGLPSGQFLILGTDPAQAYDMPGLQMRAYSLGDGPGEASAPVAFPYKGVILAAAVLEIAEAGEHIEILNGLSQYAGEDLRISVFHPAWSVESDPRIPVQHAVVAAADAPIFNAITVNADNSVTVAYTGVDGATGYKYRLDEGAAVDIGTTNPFTIPALAYATYSLQMLGYDGEADGPWSAAQEFSTLPIHSPAWTPSAVGGTPTVESAIAADTGRRWAAVVSEAELTAQQVEDVLNEESGAPSVIDWQVNDITGVEGQVGDPVEFPEGVDSAYLYTAYIDGAGAVTVLPGSVAAERATAIQLEAEPAIFSMSAQDAGLAVEKRLTADPAEFNLSAQEAGFLAHRNLAAEPAEYSLVAQDAALTRHRTLQADAATFSLSGQDADFLIDIRLTADHAVFTISGQDAAFRRDSRLAADPATFQTAGQDAVLRIEAAGVYTLIAESAAFEVTAQPAALRAERTIAASHAAFSLSGEDAGMRHFRALQAAPAVFVTVGQDAAWVRDYRLHAAGAVYAVAAQDATLRVPGDAGEFIAGNVMVARAIGRRPYRTQATARPYRTTPIYHS